MKIEKGTDLYNFIELYKSFGIEIKPFEYEGRMCVTIDHSTSEKIEGYGGFFTEYEFTLEGKFISQGAYE